MRLRLFVGFVVLAAVATLIARERGLIWGQPPRTVIVHGLANPRGLALARDGTLFVAEAGTGGHDRVVGEPDKRRYHVGLTGRVSRISPNGERSTFADGFVSAFTNHDDDIGPTGVAIVGDELFVLTAAGGWSWGDKSADNAIWRLDPSGNRARVFDYQRYCTEEPSLARRQDPRADVPGGMPFGMAARGATLFTTDGNHEFVMALEPGGTPHRVVEFPRSDQAMTGVTAGLDGRIYFTTLGGWPYLQGTGNVWRLSENGEAEVVWSGLTTPIGVAVDTDGTIYAAEFTAPLKQWPDTGRVLRRSPEGRVDEVATRLNFPTALALSREGALFVTNNGHLASDGSGEIIRLDVRPHPLSSWLAHLRGD
ncbi:MAG: ScyD/ScyE family protein [Chloroflexota bacterium]